MGKKIIASLRSYIGYTLIRSKRKTVGIYIQRGSVEVRAPLLCPKAEIDKFVFSKEKWIKNKLALWHEQAELKQNFTLSYGDTILYRGARFPITAKSGSQAGFDGKRFYLPTGLDLAHIKDICIRIYRRLAEIHITERVTEFANQMDVTPTAVKITGAKKRWGSCSSRKSINFSWRLILADDDVIDYVVVHELAHIKQMNHSQKFWAVVSDVLPDYKERKARLRDLQKRLATEDWG